MARAWSDLSADIGVHEYDEVRICTGCEKEIALYKIDHVDGSPTYWLCGACFAAR